MYLSRKIIKIFLRITSYPSFFPDTVLELPVDCTRTASLIPAPAPDLFSASVSESLQKIFSTKYKGAPAYAALQVTQLYLYPSASAFISKVRSHVSKYGLITRKEAPSISRMNLWKLLGVYRLPSASIAEARSEQISR